MDFNQILRESREGRSIGGEHDLPAPQAGLLGPSAASPRVRDIPIHFSKSILKNLQHKEKRE